jgi:Membrane-associated phospholipid phosphatase
MLIALLMWQATAQAQDLSWMATYPYGQPPTPNLIAAGLGQGPLKKVADTAVTASQPISQHSAITESHTIEPMGSHLEMPAWWNQPQKPMTKEPHTGLMAYHPAKRSPWYDTPLGVLGIGVAATGTTMLFDHGINNYAETHISYNFRKHVALNFADAVTDTAAIFTGITWFQSPWASAKLAHTSSVALTAAAVTTVEVFALKYASGRTRPSGPNSNSLSFHPFSSRYALFDTSFIFRGGTGNTSSFPSGHTAIAFALITPYAQNYHLPWLYALPVLVGVSRIVAVNGHWASDVVAGGFIGWLTADLSNRLFPNSNYGFMIFGDGVGFHGSF